MALMLKESLAENAGNPEDAFAEFGKRIESIKSDGTQEEGKKLLKMVGQKDKDTGTWEISLGSAFMSEDDDLRNALGTIGGADLREKKKRWGQYLMAILTDRKYNGGSKNGNKK